MGEIASLEKVQSAVAVLHAQGLNATADAVIAEIGGGSKTTVLKHLRAVRALEAKELDGVSSALLEAIKPGLLEIYHQGAQAEEKRTLEQTQRLHRFLGDQEAQIADFEIELQGVVDEKEGLSRTLGDIKARLAEAEEKCTRQAGEIEQLKAALAIAQSEQAVSARFLDALARIETVSNVLLAQAPDGQAVSMPRAINGETPIQRKRGRPPKARSETKP